VAGLLKINMTTLKYIINNKPKKNGKHAIYLRLTHKQTPTTIATGLEVFSFEWQKETGRVKKVKNGSNNIVRINNKLSKKQIKIECLIDILEDENKLSHLSATGLRKILCDGKEIVALNDFWENNILKQKAFKKIKTKRLYENTLKSINKFTNNRTLQFNEVNYTFLMKYEKWYLSSGGSENGLGTYLRILKAVINEAIKSEIISENDYPFKHYKIKKKDTKRRALTLSEFNKLKKLDLTNNLNLEKYQKLFLVSFYMGGIPFADLVRLKSQNIKGKEIIYSRIKTGVKVIIPIGEELISLLGDSINKEDGYLFDFIKNDDSFKNEKKYNKELNKYNSALKQIGRICGFNKALSSYVARHTFATLALNHFDFPLNFVKSSLGHKNISTTQTYIDEFSTEQRKEMFNKLDEENL